MVGKTNLTFISKGDVSNVQLIQKSYVSGTTGKIYKMEIIHNRIFIFTDEKYVLTGVEFNNLDYIKRGNEKLLATHIVYADETYYIMDINETYFVRDDKDNAINKPVIYMTTDFQNFEDIALKNTCMINNINDYTFKMNLAGLFLDSRENIIVLYYAMNTRPSGYTYPLYIAVAKSMNEILTAEIAHVTMENEPARRNESFLIDNKIYLSKGWYSLAGNYTEASDIERYNYASGYFFSTTRQYNSTIGQTEHILYRSRDGVSKIRYGYTLPRHNENDGSTYVIPISGKIGCMYIDVEGNPCLNIADDVLKVGDGENQTIQLCEPVTNIGSVVEYDGKTYLGTKYGIIYELQLDYDGIVQRPDVTVIKTLAAKQALEQSMQYTDECVAELKKYIDSKVQEQPATDENNSTEVES